MPKVTVSLPQGTRDFGAATVHKRRFIIDTIRQVLELYGFEPLETPAMENLETLMGKYGEEGDQLIFKILNNGLSNPGKEEQVRLGFDQILAGKNTTAITERALRYDLTIPFARYVAMNHAQLTMPFKRYQVQPVWRADRPQKGRYREFYQFDADVVGSNSIINEVELAFVYHTAFSRLGINQYELRINSRNILTALAAVCGVEHQLTDLTVAIDKLDKIGLEKVKIELSQRGLNESQINTVEQYLSINGSNTDKLTAIRQLFAGNATGLKGIEEIEYILQQAGTSVNLVVDFALARGLNYYTGIIFEAKAPATVKIGSIGGGGRYDDLTGLFGVPGIPGVGISFGIDRIFDVMEELQCFPQTVHKGTAVLFFNFGVAESSRALELAQQLRLQGIAAEVYPEKAKLDRQFKYAEKKGARWAVLIGTEELGNHTCNLKDLHNSTQQTISQQELTVFLTGHS